MSSAQNSRMSSGNTVTYLTDQLLCYRPNRVELMSLPSIVPWLNAQKIFVQ